MIKYGMEDELIDNNCDYKVILPKMIQDPKISLCNAYDDRPEMVKGS